MTIVTNRNCTRITLTILIGGLSLMQISKQVFAETQVTNPGTGPDVYATWEKLGDPVLGTDFTVDFSDTNNPDVQLKTGDTTWHLRSGEGSAGNFGTISIDPVVSTADFNLTISQNGTGNGATNVGSIVLSAAGWSGNSSVTGGKILGNLTNSLVVIEDGSEDGGEVTFEIGGDVSGDLTIPVVKSLTIGGDLSGDIDVGEVLPEGNVFTIEGNVEASSDINVDELKDTQSDDATMIVEGNVAGDVTFGRIGDGGSFTVLGNLSGSITMDGDLDRGSIFVVGDFTSAATITIRDMIDYAHVQFSGGDSRCH